MSVNSKSMSKISDNASDGSFNQGQFSNDANNAGFPKKKKKHGGHFINMKKGPLATQHSGG